MIIATSPHILKINAFKTNSCDVTTVNSFKTHKWLHPIE